MWDNLAAWLKQPLDTQGDALHWFYFVGFILASLWAWRMIARDWQRVAG